MPGAYGHADPLLLLLAALVVEAYLGAFGWLDRLLRPAKRWLALAAGALTARLDRPERGKRRLTQRGAFTALLLIGAALLLGWLLALFTRFYPFAWAIELLLLAALLQQRRILRDGARLLAAEAQGDLAAEREAFVRLSEGHRTPGEVAALPGPHLPAEAPGEIARRLVGALASPLLWFLLLGLPGLLAQQAARLLALNLSRGASPPFARSAVRLDRALAWLPERLAALLLVLACGRLQKPLALLASRGPAAEALMGCLPERALPREILLSAIGVVRRFCFLQGGLLALALLLGFWLR